MTTTSSCDCGCGYGENCVYRFAYAFKTIATDPELSAEFLERFKRFANNLMVVAAIEWILRKNVPPAELPAARAEFVRQFNEEFERRNANGE